MAGWDEARASCRHDPTRRETAGNWPASCPGYTWSDPGGERQTPRESLRNGWYTRRTRPDSLHNFVGSVLRACREHAAEFAVPPITTPPTKTMRTGSIRALPPCPPTQRPNGSRLCCAQATGDADVGRWLDGTTAPAPGSRERHNVDLLRHSGPVKTKQFSHTFPSSPRPRSCILGHQEVGTRT